MLLDNCVAARRAQIYLLCFRRLFVGRDARIPDQSALWSTGSTISSVSGHLESLRASFGSGFPNIEDTDNRSVGGM